MKLRCLIPGALCLALGFASCSDNDADSPAATKGGEVVEEGIPTSFTLKIAQPPQSRVADANATADEVRFVTADVFIYSNGTLIKQVTLDAGDFNEVTPGSNEYVAKDKITTTTGLKTVYVGLNMPATMVSTITASGQESGMYAIQNYTVAQLTDISDGFVMFCQEGTSKSFVDDADPSASTVNTVSAKVERLVAKITVEEGASLEYDVVGGAVSDLSFGMRNINKSIYALQKKEGGMLVDPNYDYVAGLPSPYTSAAFAQTAIADYQAINPKNTPVKDLNKAYALENATKLYYQLETTYASLRAKFSPNVYTKLDGSTKTTNDNPTGSFWVVRLTEDLSTHYFDDYDDAVAFATNKGTVSDEYVGGYCYYNMWVNPNGSPRYQTVRNDFYRMTVSKIYGIGNPNPTDEGEEEKPVVTPANILVDIEIVPWNVISDEYEL